MKMNDFRIVRQNALANPSLYGGRFTQEDEAEAYAEYLRDVYSSTKETSVAKELTRLQRAKLYKSCVKVLDVKRIGFRNLFQLASSFTDLTISLELSPADDFYEIKSKYTKSGQPYIVEF